MTAAELAEWLEGRVDGFSGKELDGTGVVVGARKTLAIAALLRRAARVEEAARNVLAAADLCDYWYEADIAPLRAALEEKA